MSFTETLMFMKIAHFHEHDMSFTGNTDFHEDHMSGMETTPF